MVAFVVAFGVVVAFVVAFGVAVGVAVAFGVAVGVAVVVVVGVAFGVAVVVAVAVAVAITGNYMTESNIIDAPQTEIVATSRAATFDNLVLMISAIDSDSSLDSIGEAMQRMDFIKEEVRLADKDLKDRIIAYIESHGGQGIQIGNFRYWVGPDKETKCNDVRATTEAALQATGGSVDDLCCLLSVNAYKPGACKKLFTKEQFAALFTTTEKKRLKSDGVTEEKQLQKADERFIGGK